MNVRQAVLHGFVFSAWIFAAESLLGCGANARDFLKDKTGVIVPSEVNLCPTSLQDNEMCRPEGLGGPEWVRNKNVAPYPIPTATTETDTKTLVTNIRTYYIGTPFYGADLHFHPCKDGLTDGDFPDDKSYKAPIDLMQSLKTQSVDDVALSLKAKLEAKGIASAQIVDDFKARFATALEQSVKSRVVWFAIRHPGGKIGLNYITKLDACREELRRRLPGARSLRA
jgi:hypothetical protein